MPFIIKCNDRYLIWKADWRIHTTATINKATHFNTKIIPNAIIHDFSNRPYKFNIVSVKERKL